MGATVAGGGNWATSLETDADFAACFGIRIGGTVPGDPGTHNSRLRLDLAVCVKAALSNIEGSNFSMLMKGLL